MNWSAEFGLGSPIFADEDAATEYAARLRWPDGPACPRCRSKAWTLLRPRRLRKCRDCKYQYSVKVGTVFEDSAIPMHKWLRAIWAEANESLSSYQLADLLDVCQETAQQMARRIRTARRIGEAA